MRIMLLPAGHLTRTGIVTAVLTAMDPIHTHPTIIIAHSNSSHHIIRMHQHSSNHHPTHHLRCTVVKHQYKDRGKASYRITAQHRTIQAISMVLDKALLHPRLHHITTQCNNSLHRCRCRCQLHSTWMHPSTTHMITPISHKYHRIHRPLYIHTHPVLSCHSNRLHSHPPHHHTNYSSSRRILNL
jgi:hypothetical protein